MSGEYLLPLGDRGYLALPTRLVERHLTPEADTAICQAIGICLQILVPSERDDLLLRVSLEGWLAEKPYERVLTRQRIHVGRWVQYLQTSAENGETCVTARSDTIDYDPLP